MHFLAIDHPAIACRDVRRQIDWYCRHLGMRVIAINSADPPSAVVGYSADARGGRHDRADARARRRRCAGRRASFRPPAFAISPFA